MGDLKHDSLSPSSSLSSSTTKTIDDSTFTSPHTLLIAIPSNPRLHTVTSYWAPSTSRSPLPQCFHTHSRLAFDQITCIRHHKDHGTVTIPNIGFDLASYLHMQVLMLKSSSENEEFVEELVRSLSMPREGGRSEKEMERDMQVRIMSVQILGSEVGKESLLDGVGDGDGNMLMWKWMKGGESGMWEGSLERAVSDAEKRAENGCEGGIEILVKGRNESEEK